MESKFQVSGTRPKRRSSVKVLPPKPKKLVTAAIDFGTRYSGYAYSFNHEPLNIHANAWNYGGYTTRSCKAPSSVLLNKDRSFHSFGFEAEETYDHLTETEQHEGWYFFEQFKMKLYSAEKLTLGTTIKDIEGREMPAIVIFSMVIEAMKQHMVTVAQQSKGKGLLADDIFWILTVPAIWSDSAKHFMRVAANKAGITNDQLRLVLEPEAASFYCQTKCHIKHGNGQNKLLEKFGVGFKYIILDNGGGTVDITIHEVLHNENLREIQRTTGGALGSCRIEEAFLKLLLAIFGESVMTRFKMEDRSNYRKLLSEFEEKKRRVRLEGDSTMNIPLPTFLFEIVHEERGQTIKECINKAKEAGYQVQSRRDKLTISSDLVKSFFEGTVGKIVDQVKSIIRVQHDIDAILAVGGFSESPYLKESITKMLQGTTIQLLAPEEPGNHVMYGATLTNIFPQKIAERISRYSYGFKVEEPYEENKHNGHKIIRDSGSFCSDVYHEIIPIGRRLKYDETISYDEIGGNRSERKFERTPVEFWCSDRQNTKLCVPELGCKKVGTIELIPPPDGWPDEVQFSIKLKIGEAEFCITVVDIHSGREFKTNVDFLTE